MKKKILYIHGFCSSAQTATVHRLRENMPECEIHAIDVDHHPVESIALIERYVAENGIDLLLGASLGGFYTLCSQVDIPKVAVNPAVRPHQSLNRPDMMGTHTYFNPRADGVMQFTFGPADLEAFKGIPFHITPTTYIIASDHDELLGNLHDDYRRLVGDRFTVTNQIGHRMDATFVAPHTGDLWNLLQRLL